MLNDLIHAFVLPFHGFISSFIDRLAEKYLIAICLYAISDLISVQV